MRERTGLGSLMEIVHVDKKFKICMHVYLTRLFNTGPIAQPGQSTIAEIAGL